MKKRTEVKIISDNDNYIKFIDKVLIITHVAHNRSEHPGYDEGVGGCLYDLKVKETGEDVPFSLYDYEIKKA
jgi:hypothetical protein